MMRGQDDEEEGGKGRPPPAAAPAAAALAAALAAASGHALTSAELALLEQLQAGGAIAPQCVALDAERLARAL